MQVSRVAGIYCRYQERETEETRMDDNRHDPMSQTGRPQQGKDLDDIIFRGEGWLASDR